MTNLKSLLTTGLAGTLALAVAGCRSSTETFRGYYENTQVKATREKTDTLKRDMGLQIVYSLDLTIFTFARDSDGDGKFEEIDVYGSGHRYYGADSSRQAIYRALNNYRDNINSDEFNLIFNDIARKARIQEQKAK